MPYILPEDRERLDEDQFPLNCGELNYCITQLIIGYVSSKGRSYQTFNDIIGTLENAKIEFARRVIAKYEDKKKEDNGDVFE